MLIEAVAVLLAILSLTGLLWKVEARNAVLNRRIRRYAGKFGSRKKPALQGVRRWLRLVRAPHWIRDRRTAWITLGMFLGAGLVAGVSTRQWWLALAVGAGAAGGTIYLRNALYKRAVRRQFLAEFPEAVDSLTRLVAVGVSVDAALGEMGRYFSEPVRSQFETMKNQLELGVPFASVMRKLAAGIDIPELEFFCTVLIINRDVGGRISDVLMRLSQGLRERSNASRELEILTAEPRTTAKVVALIPLGLVGVLAMFNPASFQFLVSDPVGRLVLVYVLASILLGLAIIWRMTRFE